MRIALSQGRASGSQEHMKLIAVVLLCWLFALAGRTAAQPPAQSEPAPVLVLAHYMPWYVAKPNSPLWGWHWTMNHFDPERLEDGKRQIASHFYPLIGPYDSADPHVIEYHLLLMKLAGVDGVIVDWYGLQEFRDYAILHANTRKLVEHVQRLGMNFSICYEDQTIPALVEAGRLNAKERVAHAQKEISWLAEHWFASDSYVKLDGKPVLLSFGHAGLTAEEWKQCLASLRTPVTYFSEHFRREGAVGAFDWPNPKQGLSSIERFRTASRDWPHAIPVAFPRFVDIYAEAKVHASYGRIEDSGGETFQETLASALSMKPRIMQISTWNDWGEGTIVEPSREFGYRNLELLQKTRREHIDSRFTLAPEDLRLPTTLLELRRQTAPDQQQQLDKIAEMIATGRVAEARKQLQGFVDAQSYKN